MTRLLALLLAPALAGAAQADPPEILSAVADRQGDGWGTGLVPLERR